MFASVVYRHPSPPCPAAQPRYPTDVNSLRTTCGSALPTPSRRGFVRAMSSRTASHALAAAQRIHRRFGAVVPQGAGRCVESRGASRLHAIVTINNAAADPLLPGEQSYGRAPTRPPPTRRRTDGTIRHRTYAPLSTRPRPRAPPRPRPAASAPPPWRGRCRRASAARTRARRASPICRGTPAARSSGRRPCRRAHPPTP